MAAGIPATGGSVMQCELVRVYIIVIIITIPVSQFVGGTKQRVGGSLKFLPRPVRREAETFSSRDRCRNFFLRRERGPNVRR